MGSGERLSDDEIAAIAARCEKATPGPWRVDVATYDVRAYLPGNEAHPCFVADADCRDRAGHVSARNAAFIAHARTDVPRLLAECARLRAVEAAAISACELEGGPGEDAALEDLRAALRGGR